MLSIIVICLIQYSTAPFTFKTEWKQKESIAQCYSDAKNRWTGSVVTWKTFDTTRPVSMQEYEVHCGAEGRDCK